MTKNAAGRSLMRRVALTKVADAYSDMMYGYRNAYRPGIVRGGVGVAVNDNLRKQYGRVPPPPRPPAPRVPQMPQAVRPPAQQQIPRR